MAAAYDDEYESDFEEVEEVEEPKSAGGGGGGGEQTGVDALRARCIALHEAGEARELEAAALREEVAQLRARLEQSRRGRGRPRSARPGGERTGGEPGAAAAAATAAARPRPSREVRLDDVEVGPQLAGGGFCTLHRGRWEGVTVAVKRIFDPVMTPELRAEFDNEAELLDELRHPNVVALLGAVSVPPTLCLVTEFMPRGSLYRVLHEEPDAPWSAAEALAASLGVARALQFAHSRGVVHRDIKSQNVLVGDAPSRVKLCDFGLARREAALRAAARPPPPQGTPAYMAPELWDGSALPSPASDVYALGVLLCEIWSRDVPFDSLDAGEIRERAAGRGARPDMPPASRLPRGRSAEWRRLIAQCWDADPARRPSARDVADFCDRERA